jgi:hypothetical protein
MRYNFEPRGLREWNKRGKLWTKDLTRNRLKGNTEYSFLEVVGIPGPGLDARRPFALHVLHF